MILADTSIWIEFFRLHPEIHPALKKEMEQQNIIAAESVFGELLQGAKGQREMNIIMQYWENLPRRSEAGLWLEAGVLSSQQKWYAKGVGLIDAFLIALAKKHRLQIWTLDKKLRSVIPPGLLFD